MATVSNFALRLPPSVLADVKDLAAADAMSVNQFLVQAAAEKVAVLKDRASLAARAARARPGDMEALLARAGTAALLPGDALPEGWEGYSNPS